MAYTHELNQDAARSYGYEVADVIHTALRNINAEILLNRQLESDETDEWLEEYSKLTDPIAALHVEDNSVLERIEQNDDDVNAIIISAIREVGNDQMVAAYEIVTRQGY